MLALPSRARHNWHMPSRALLSFIAFLSILIPAVSSGETAPPEAGALASQELGSTINLSVHEDERYALFLFAYHATRNASGQRLRGYLELSEDDQAALARVQSEFAPLAAAFEPYITSHPGLSGDLGVTGAKLTGGDYDGADERLIAALDEFLPVYRREFAPRHSAISSAYASMVRAQLAEHGDAMARAVAREVSGRWRTRPIRIDVAPYVTFLGAFTNPHHTVISASHEEYRNHALEMVFHEAAHTAPMDEPLKEAANAALEKHGLSNERFWHYLQFYAIGRAAQSVLGDDYVPFHEATGLSRGVAAEYYAAIDAVWDEHDRLVERADAAAALVAARRQR